MIKGAIFDKSENGHTYFRKIFSALNNFQKDYNWLITDCEACPIRQGHAERILQSKNRDYAWISGEELTGIIKKDDFQWIWAVLSGFDKRYSKEEVLKYEFPFADGYRGFWKEELSIQHPLASIELVAWDGAFTLIISKNEDIINRFRDVFPLSRDLQEENNSEIKAKREEERYRKWLQETTI